jgi:hypothetical protein
MPETLRESEPLSASAAALLTRHHRIPVTVTAWQPIPPWPVARVHLVGEGLPATAIVKRPNPDRPAEASDDFTRRVRTEAAALRYLAGTRLAPRLLAVDLAAGYLVQEDLGPLVALDTLLRRDGAAPHADRVVAHAAAHGRLAAATAGRRMRPPQLSRRVIPDTELGVALDGRAAGDLAAARAELTAPGPFLTLGNGDPETNNTLVDPAADRTDARLIDFEFTGPVHALDAAVNLLIPGPAWMTVGRPELRARALAAHRRALAEAVPEAADDRRHGFGLAAACLDTAVGRLQRLPRLDLRSPADGGRAQLVNTLESAAAVADEARALPHLAGWARRAAAVLRRRWSDADQDFGALLPYQPRR